MCLSWTITCSLGQGTHAASHEQSFPPFRPSRRSPFCNVVFFLTFTPPTKHPSRSFLRKPETPRFPSPRVIFEPVITACFNSIAPLVSLIFPNSSPFHNRERGSPHPSPQMSSSFSSNPHPEPLFPSQQISNSLICSLTFRPPPLINRSSVSRVRFFLFSLRGAVFDIRCFLPNR